MVYAFYFRNCGATDAAAVDGFAQGPSPTRVSASPRDSLELLSGVAHLHLCDLLELCVSLIGPVRRVCAEWDRRARPSRVGLGHLHDRREMTQAAKWSLRFGSETRDLVRRQVAGNALERGGAKQAAIDDESTGARQ